MKTQLSKKLIAFISSVMMFSGIINAQTPCAVPTKPGAITSSPSAKACPGDTRTYSVVDIASGWGLDYQWTVPAGATIVSGQGSHIITVSYNAGFIAAGYLTVTRSNDCGTSPVRSLIIHRNNPTIPSVISGPANICPGNDVTYSVIPVASMAYHWTFPAGFQSQEWPPYSQQYYSYEMLIGNGFPATGVITVKESNACGTSTARRLNVSRNPAPAAPSAIHGPSTSCIWESQVFWINSVPNATSYNWQVPVGAGIIAAQSNDTLKTVEFHSGVGPISVQSVNNCGVSATVSHSVAISCRQGLNSENTGELKITATPNPTEGNITLNFNSNNSSDYSIRILDNIGKTISTEKFMAQEGINIYSLDLSHFAKGIYMVNVQNGEQNKTIKVVRK